MKKINEGHIDLLKFKNIKTKTKNNKQRTSVIDKAE